MKKNLQLLSRAKDPKFVSIEGIFDNLAKYFISSYNVINSNIPYNRLNLNNIISNRKFVKNISGDVIHITGHINYLAVFSRHPIIITIHDIESFYTKSKFKNVLISICWFIIPCIKAKKITVISDFTRVQLLEKFPFLKKKVTVVPNPISSQLTYTSKPVNTCTPAILHLGTKENKNLERTIKALKDIPCKLIIVGKLTDEQTELLKSYKINYQNEYHIPFSRIIELYQECDLVSFVSTYEGFGMPIIEANAVGRPVITSNTSSMPEVASNAALLVDPYSIDEIREGIEKIIKDHAYRESLIQNGLENIKRFAPEVVAHQYIDIYNSVLNTAP